MEYEFPAQVPISAQCRDLLCRILVADPNRRITIPGIQQHAWYRQARPSPPPPPAWPVSYPAPCCARAWRRAALMAFQGLCLVLWRTSWQDLMPLPVAPTVWHELAASLIAASSDAAPALLERLLAGSAAALCLTRHQQAAAAS